MSIEEIRAKQPPVEIRFPKPETVARWRLAVFKRDGAVSIERAGLEGEKGLPAVGIEPPDTDSGETVTSIIAPGEFVRQYHADRGLEVFTESSVKGAIEAWAREEGIVYNTPGLDAE